MKNKQLLVPLILVVIAVLIALATVIVITQSSPKIIDENIAGGIVADRVVGITGVTVANVASIGSVGESRMIEWATSNYPAEATVNINLIRKVGENPETFEFVKRIAENTPNDGQEIWNIDTDLNEGDFYIEVTCSDSSSQNGCRVSGQPIMVI